MKASVIFVESAFKARGASYLLVQYDCSQKSRSMVALFMQQLGQIGVITIERCA